jgi:hypothetical protein
VDLLAPVDVWKLEKPLASMRSCHTSSYFWPFPRDRTSSSVITFADSVFHTPEAWRSITSRNPSHERCTTQPHVRIEEPNGSHMKSYTSTFSKSGSSNVQTS